MIIVDVNVLVGAHRADLREHDDMRTYLDRALDGPSAVGAPDYVLAGFLRIVTNRRIFRVATEMRVALEFVRALRARSNWLPAEPSERTWAALERLIEATGVLGDDIPDAHLAALAISHGGELASGDRGFGRFPGLRWVNPIAG